VVALLARAARAFHEVRFDYAAASGEETSRRAEPYRLVATTSRWYLLAWDLDRGDWRSFRLDRMSEVRESTFTFRPREAPDAAEHVREGLTRGPQGVDVVLDLDAPLDVVADALPTGVGELFALGDRCELRFSAWDVPSAAARLAWLPWEFRIVSPVDLGAEVAALAARLAGAARSAS
jgi:predicted DNA-binding transcriptional regulator YafY